MPKTGDDLAAARLCEVWRSIERAEPMPLQPAPAAVEWTRYVLLTLVHLRPADSDEVEALHRLAERAYAKYVERLGRRPAPMDDDYAARIAAGGLIVAERASQSVGFIVLVAASDHLLVENVAVDPGYQGRGVSRALLAHAEATAARLGLPELRLYTNAAMTENLELYPRLGYREVRRCTEHGFQRVFFTKPVPGR